MIINIIISIHCVVECGSISISLHGLGISFRIDNVSLIIPIVEDSLWITRLAHARVSVDPGGGYSQDSH